MKILLILLCFVFNCFSSSCTFNPKSKNGKEELSTSHRAKREIVFDSFMNPSIISWFHNDRLFYQREIDKIQPSASKISYFLENVDTSLMILPKMNYTEEMNEVKLNLTFDSYPLVLSRINCKPAIFRSESYNDRSQILFFFQAPLDSIDISIDYLNDNGEILKRIENVTLVLVDNDY